MPALEFLSKRIDHSDKEIAHDYAGPLQIGAFFSLILYGMFLQQCAAYWKKWRSDPIWVRILVTWFMVLCTAFAVLCMLTSYRYSIIDFSNGQALYIILPTHIVTEMLLAPLAVTAQCFFAYRVLKLTGIRWALLIVCVLGTGEMACALVVGVQSFVAKSYRFINLVPPLAAAAIMAPIADLITAVILVRYLLTHRTGVEETDSLMAKAIRFTIQTGALTVFIAIAALILSIFEHHNLSFIDLYPAGLIYPLCVMSALNCRHEWGTQSEGQLHMQCGLPSRRTSTLKSSWNVANLQSDITRPPGGVKSFPDDLEYKIPEMRIVTPPILAQPKASAQFNEGNSRYSRRNDAGVFV